MEGEGARRGRGRQGETGSWGGGVMWEGSEEGDGWQIGGGSRER